MQKIMCVLGSFTSDTEVKVCISILLAMETFIKHSWIKKDNQEVLLVVPSSPLQTGFSCDLRVTSLFEIASIKLCFFALSVATVENIFAKPEILICNNKTYSSKWHCWHLSILAQTNLLLWMATKHSVGWDVYTVKYHVHVPWFCHSYTLRQVLLNKWVRNCAVGINTTLFMYNLHVLNFSSKRWNLHNVM